MEEAIRKALVRAEEIYQLSMKKEQYSAAIEATNVVCMMEGKISQIDAAKAQFEAEKAAPPVGSTEETFNKATSVSKGSK